MAQTRQAIIDAIETRMATITTPTFRTTLGSSVAVWKRNKFAANRLPGLNIKDTSDDQQADAEDESLTLHRMTVDLQAIGKDGATTDELVREMIADIEQAIGVDESWGGLADRTVIVRNVTDVAQDEETIGGATITLEIQFTTERFKEE
jgi:hypothetical protein